MSLILPSKAYRPFQYPQAYEFWKRQQQVHWLAAEVPMGQDVRDWAKLDPKLRDTLTWIFRMFVQADIDVHKCYHKLYQTIFLPTEVQMMLSAFSNMETVHIDAYSHLMTTLGLPESEYHAFLDYTEMKAKHDWMHSFNPNNPEEVAASLAGVSGFGEGLMLFASFAMLLNLPRHNLMKGMGQIVSWSVRDESLHCEGIMWLYHTYLREKAGEIDRERLSRKNIETCRESVRMEDAFIDLVHQHGDMPGVAKDEFKAHIRNVANIRLRQLGELPIYDDAKYLPWFDTQASGVEHANFFEQQGTAYSRAATEGEWGEAF
ncbi:ribonucleoside-diphosphate reductase beta chain [Sphingomonas sp. NFR04]|jgi:ribonucleoside-diphosphate reductase beta chain|uniref:ribonucleotide-diphosphate reductase subunit beta n=1 Tax=Sphingomonas sp. NFR04 TaxID=1566283 RepID=UPI0008EF0F6D|nr:ribonucleotide-diphosphate reductase subunit beta [Sphingomonas sp. NFR04]SFJ49386.1 ribonucleoside-diphosphate reductase beta chain [Sphingomonas sp. NFR04]